MAATPVVIFLVGLVIPILLIACAILFDVAVLIWAAHRLWHDRLAPNFARVLAMQTLRVRRAHLLHR